jgi:Macrocin-O-methyltransferase (TylF)
MSVNGGHSQNPRLTRVASSSIWTLRHLLGGQRSETLISRFGLDDLRSLYYLYLGRALWSKKLREKPFSGFITYYEFGVGWGYTLTRYVDALKAFCKDEHLNLYNQKIFLFDSFQGLPDTEGVKDEHPEWGKGSFAHGKDEIKNLLKYYKLDPENPNINFIEGFYEQTLTSDLARQLTTTAPDVVTIDVDYYSSTKTILDWIQPFLPSGCLLYVDNIWSYNGSPSRGELGAINDFNKTGRGLLVPFEIMPGLPNLCYIYEPD